LSLRVIAKEAQELSDDKVDEIRRHAQAMAHLLIETAAHRFDIETYDWQATGHAGLRGC
jgi:hypothetical protein